MTATTIHTKHGATVRSASQRRFVVIREQVNAATGRAVSARIDKRSDSVDTLRTHVRRVATFTTAGGVFIAHTIVDTVTGAEVV